MGDDEERRAQARHDELHSFLRRRRERLSPGRVGLPRTSRRRTPGLRREEVAELAGISADWVARLEQGRAAGASAQVLESLARALQLDAAERRQLFVLAGQHPPPTPTKEVASEALWRVLDRQEWKPAYAMGRRWDLIAYNTAARLVFGDLNAVPENERNVVWLMFTDEDLRRRIVDWEGHAQRVLAQFRVVYGEHAGDPWFDALVEPLKKVSPEFGAWWPLHEIRGRAEGRKDIDNLALEQTSYALSDDPGVQLVLYMPLDDMTANRLRCLLDEEEKKAAARANGALSSRFDAEQDHGGATGHKSDAPVPRA